MATREHPRGPKQPVSEPPAVKWWILVSAVVLIALILLISTQTHRGNIGKVKKGIPTPPSNFQWSERPEMSIDLSKNYTAIIRSEIGDIVVRLFVDKSPITVNNVIFLAQQGYYDGVTFHRVLPGFMAQSGDRTGTGAGGPGYHFQDEVDNGLEFDRKGLIAMANSGPNTNGSQFFITYGPTPHLNGAHTIFGEVTKGMDVLLAVRRRDPQTDRNPGTVIETILIDEQ